MKLKAINKYVTNSSSAFTFKMKHSFYSSLNESIDWINKFAVNNQRKEYYKLLYNNTSKTYR